MGHLEINSPTQEDAENRKVLGIFCKITDISSDSNITRRFSWIDSLKFAKTVVFPRKLLYNITISCVIVQNICGCDRRNDYDDS